MSPRLRVGLVERVRRQAILGVTWQRRHGSPQDCAASLSESVDQSGRGQLVPAQVAAPLAKVFSPVRQGPTSTLAHDQPVCERLAPCSRVRALIS
jgi:hypothetical protein